MKNITPREAKNKLDHHEKLNIIDVREPEEVMFGMIPGAKNIPLGTIPEHLEEMDKNEEYIIVCQSGGRSMHATMFLENQGFKVMNMTGGMSNWNWETV
ncbi:rhodanese-like domain-containing protein [Peribacillus tepidiphilus]|uniref:rhodanese-like domain-containing protein n=1 Tax=Peribacillus tepidiphilus TaxID=2652445 RepID=UPI001290EA85|nr:rhodanese-like domain-containing protein [Peribacillus tepidiphilus]